MRISALLVRSPGNCLSSEIDCGGRFPAAEESPSASSIPNLGSRNEKKNCVSKQNRGPPQELINAQDCTLETCPELRRIENNCVKFLRTGNQASLFSTWQPDLRINRNRQATMEPPLQESARKTSTKTPVDAVLYGVKPAQDSFWRGL